MSVSYIVARQLCPHARPTILLPELLRVSDGGLAVVCWLIDSAALQALKARNDIAQGKRSAALGIKARAFEP